MIECFDSSYLKMCGLKASSSYKELMEKMRWGTYGRPATLPIKWVRLIDCSIEHLENIIKTQHHIDEITRRVIGTLLNRKKCRKNGLQSIW